MKTFPLSSTLVLNMSENPVRYSWTVSGAKTQEFEFLIEAIQHLHTRMVNSEIAAAMNDRIDIAKLQTAFRDAGVKLLQELNKFSDKLYEAVHHEGNQKAKLAAAKLFQPQAAPALPAAQTIPTIPTRPATAPAAPAEHGTLSQGLAKTLFKKPA